MHIFGYLYKFINTIRSPNLSVEILCRGTDILIRIVQKAQLEGKAMESSSNLSSLSPFLCKMHGLIGLGSRLQNSILALEARHPVILLKESIIMQEPSHCLHFFGFSISRLAASRLYRVHFKNA